MIDFIEYLDININFCKYFNMSYIKKKNQIIGAVFLYYL